MILRFRNSNRHALRGEAIRPIDGRFAREVLGAEVWRDIPAADMQKIQAAWADWGVIVFRRQALSESELVAAKFQRIFYARPRLTWSGG